MQTKKHLFQLIGGELPVYFEYMLLKRIRGPCDFLFSTKETLGPPQRAKDINSGLDGAGILATIGTLKHRH